MAEWLSAEYRDFYDVPRMIVARCDLGTFLFFSRFDDVADDYSDNYELYLMPTLSAADLAGSWVGLEARALKRLPDLGIRQFPFDVARREFLEYDSLNSLLQRESSSDAAPSNYRLERP
jgi:hypothetical protein